MASLQLKVRGGCLQWRGGSSGPWHSVGEKIHNGELSVEIKNCGGKLKAKIFAGRNGKSRTEVLGRDGTYLVTPRGTNRI